MTNKIALHSIVVRRDKKTVVVAPGTSFDFTKDELDGFDAMEKAHKDAEAHLSTKTPFRAIVRDPINESPIVVPEQKAGADLNKGGEL